MRSKWRTFRTRFKELQVLREEAALSGSPQLRLSSTPALLNSGSPQLRLSSAPALLNSGSPQLRLSGPAFRDDSKMQIVLDSCQPRHPPSLPSFSPLLPSGHDSSE
uniref:Uncharacterized protein n=1 Tax=Knipowitschia caucasica TaxID=637954 RepID=A0AAV2M461_KNICA